AVGTVRRGSTHDEDTYGVSGDGVAAESRFAFYSHACDRIGSRHGTGWVDSDEVGLDLNLRTPHANPGLEAIDRRGRYVGVVASRGEVESDCDAVGRREL